MTKRDFLSIMELDQADLDAIYGHAFELKKAWSERREVRPLKGCTLAMLFEKPSLRTRATFDIGINQMGGHSIEVTDANAGFGSREAIVDIARNIDRWCDLVMIRTFGRERIEMFAGESSAPVMNALTNEEHPCQVLADFMALMSVTGSRDLSGFKLSYVGDGNNVSHSLICLAALHGMEMTVGTPEGYEPQAEFQDWAVAMNEKTGGKLRLTNDPHDAARGAQAVYTDVWASMGWETEAETRAGIFEPFQVNAELMAEAAEGAYAMHDLPAHRGEEITDEVMDGPNSIIYDQAEHRLHAQKGVMAWLAEQSGIRSYT